MSVVRSLAAVARFIQPNSGQFFDLLEESAKRLAACCADAKKATEEGLWSNPSTRAALMGQVASHDDNAAEVIHNTTVELDKTFVTPIDRGDIVSLVSEFRQVVEDVTETLRKANRRGLGALPTGSAELADLLNQAATKISAAVSGLRTRQGLPELTLITAEIRALEKRGDAVFEEAVARLYTNGATDAVGVTKEDFLEGLEGALDECERLADVIEGIALKNA